MVDEEGAAADEGIARADHRQGSLGLLGTMVDGGEKFGVNAPEAGKGDGIDAVGLLGVGRDELDLAWVGDDDLVAKRGKEA
jgi:hypothetical protein